LPSGVVCVKRALPQLKVAAEWQVPVERNRYEVEWLRVAAESSRRGAAAARRGPRARAFAMAWLEPERYPVWKSLSHKAPARGPGARSRRRVRPHPRRDRRPRRLAARFPTDALFHALRLDPYLVTAAQRNRKSPAACYDLVARHRRTRRALVHGDASPKNILIGPRGPVILDAECAWYGDPAFDLAFVLNHLVLKSALQPRAARRIAR
jgi:hypothetical protein